jgi:RNA polymerase sigma factor (sigma-70 family)
LPRIFSQCYSVKGMRGLKGVINVRMGPSTKVEPEVETDLLEELVPKLNRYCLFLTKDKWDGEDIVQETIVKALKHYDLEKWSASLLKKIAYHLWIDRMRKEEQESLFSPDQLPEKAENSLGEGITELVDKMLNQLTPKQLVSFVLKEGFRYKISEIADLLDMSETGVKALLNRARFRIKQHSDHKLESYWPEEIRVIVYPALIRAITLQDPTELLTLAPNIFTHSVISYKAVRHSPSNILSLAA